MLDGRLRSAVDRSLAPLGRGLRRAGITADVLTVAGLALSLLTGWLIAIGELRWAVLGIIGSGLTDLLDGTVARQSGRSSPRGAFFDSVCDRLSDAAYFGGVAWYVSSQNPRLAVLALAVLAFTMIITYERARAESLGYEARGGLMERAERMVILGVALLFHVLVAALWIMLTLCAYTAVQRFAKVWRQASDPPARPRRLSLVRHRRADLEGLDLAAGDEARGLARWWEARRPSAPRGARTLRASRRSRP